MESQVGELSQQAPKSTAVFPSDTEKNPKGEQKGVRWEECKAITILKEVSEEEGIRPSEQEPEILKEGVEEAKQESETEQAKELQKGTYSFEIDGRAVSFNLDDALKHPPEDHSIFQCDIIDETVAEVHQEEVEEKDVEFELSEDCMEAFDKLKIALTQAPIVRGLDWSRPFEIMCDAFNYSVGAALTQREDYGKACHLPVEVEYKGFWAVRECNLGLGGAGTERKLQLQELENLRLEAYENSRLYKERFKDVHDNIIKRREFRPGELVLVYNSWLRLMPGKLRSWWEELMRYRSW
ncbi:uncharacterized protein LOC107646926 [Arachis ipaensis]|uniref:uncharacterized protein LOC107646926 n=1 Tax=Arachis ipaensis TaxID=130454 RepID=UPI0007AFB829|nr:uncharacterized protein LOC107646926 [Arachis ipaensis]